MKTTELTRIALMAAVLCVLAPISIPIPVNSVALSLATFAIYLMAYILKPKQALASVSLYLLLGAAGLPIFAGYLGGISRFASPSGGYLIGYLLLAGGSSWAVHRFPNTILQLSGMFLSTLLMYGTGILWFAFTTETPLFSALLAGTLVFLPADIIKMLFAAYIGRKIQHHIK